MAAMKPTSRGRYDLKWRRNNLAALILLCAVAAGWLGARYFFRSTDLGRTPPVNAARVNAAEEKIDPNTASAASLQRLEGIGEAKAQAIVEYRESHGPAAYTQPADLAKVKGIGPRIVSNIERNLKFPRQGK